MNNNLFAGSAYDLTLPAGWSSFRFRSHVSCLPFPGKRMYYKTDHRDGDARIGDVEGRPWMRVRNVQIEKEKIDHVAMEQTIGKISQDPRQ